MKILFLEDDELFAETIEEFLIDSGFEVTLSRNGEEALDSTFLNSFDLYLFDINTPLINGIDLLRSLRESGDNTPAFFLTSYIDKNTLAKGFGVGCNDYIRKPVDLDELLLRINVYNKQSQKALTISSDFALELNPYRLLKNEIDVMTSPKTLRLLHLFLLNNAQIVSNEQIEEFLYDNESNPSKGSVRVFVNSIKNILGKNSIENIRGIGYKFDAKKIS
jgi:DNA-binding response OmpR family regulator